MKSQILTLFFDAIWVASGRPYPCLRCPFTASWALPESNTVVVGIVSDPIIMLYYFLACIAKGETREDHWNSPASFHTHCHRVDFHSRRLARLARHSLRFGCNMAVGNRAYIIQKVHNSIHSNDT